MNPFVILRGAVCKYTPSFASSPISQPEPRPSVPKSEPSIARLTVLAMLEDDLRRSKADAELALQRAREEAAEREAEREREWIEKIQRSALRKMLSRQLSRGWDTWVAAWEDEREARRKMVAFVKRLVNREALRAWEVWFEGWREQARSRRAVGRARTAAPSAQAAERPPPPDAPRARVSSPWPPPERASAPG